MKAHELLDWLATADEKGARKLRVERASKRGQVAKGALFAEETFPVDGDRLLERMREDLTSRRLHGGTFLLCAADGKGVSVMQERLQLLADEQNEGGSDNEFGAVYRVVQSMCDQTIKMAESMRVMARENNDSQQKVIADLSSQIVAMQGKMGETLEAAFTVATLREESLREARASEERRELAKSAFTTMGPIVGALLTKLGKGVGPAFQGLFRSLTEDQLKSLAGILTAEQIGVFSTIIEELQTDEDKRQASEKKP